MSAECSISTNTYTHTHTHLCADTYTNRSAVSQPAAADAPACPAFRWKSAPNERGRSCRCLPFRAFPACKTTAMQPIKARALARYRAKQTQVHTGAQGCTITSSWRVVMSSSSNMLKIVNNCRSMAVNWCYFFLRTAVQVHCCFISSAMTAFTDRCRRTGAGGTLSVAYGQRSVVYER